MTPEPDLIFPPFRLDREHEQLWRGTDPVPLRSKAFAVLRYLAAQAPRLVTSTELLQAVWGEAYMSESLLRRYIRELRAVLGDEAQAPRFIATVLRRGWRFVAPVTVAAAPPLLPTPEAPPPPPRAVQPTSEGLLSAPMSAILAEEYKLVTVVVMGLRGVMTLAQAVEAEDLYALLRRAAALMRQEGRALCGRGHPVHGRASGGALWGSPGPGGSCCPCPAGGPGAAAGHGRLGR
jgi:DNA-binding winged helix-turn-helix (wHTH) protein